MDKQVKKKWGVMIIVLLFACGLMLWYHVRTKEIVIEPAANVKLKDLGLHYKNSDGSPLD